MLLLELISNNNSELLIQNWYRDHMNFVNLFIPAEKKL